MRGSERSRHHPHRDSDQEQPSGSFHDVLSLLDRKVGTCQTIGHLQAAMVDKALITPARAAAAGRDYFGLGDFCAQL